MINHDLPGFSASFPENAAFLPRNRPPVPDAGMPYHEHSICVEVPSDLGEERHEPVAVVFRRLEDPSGMEPSEPHLVGHEIELLHGDYLIYREALECNHQLPPLPGEGIVPLLHAALDVTDELFQPGMLPGVGAEDGRSELHELGESFVDHGELHGLGVLRRGGVLQCAHEGLELLPGAVPVEPPHAAPGAVHRLQRRRGDRARSLRDLF